MQEAAMIQVLLGLKMLSPARVQPYLFEHEEIVGLSIWRLKVWLFAQASFKLRLILHTS